MVKSFLKRGASVTATDVAEQMAKAIAAAEAEVGPIDCLVPNAGIASGGGGFS